MKTNCKLHLINLMNLLENQLFQQERVKSQYSQAILTSHYIDHIRKGLDLEEKVDTNIDKVLDMEGLFYCERYEDAWKMLLKMK